MHLVVIGPTMPCLAQNALRHVSQLWVALVKHNEHEVSPGCIVLESARGGVSSVDRAGVPVGVPKGSYRGWSFFLSRVGVDACGVCVDGNPKMVE